MLIIGLGEESKSLHAVIYAARSVSGCHIRWDKLPPRI